MRKDFGIEVKEEDSFVIGRENSLLCIVDKKVSRKQAVLSFEIGLFFFWIFFKKFILIYYFLSFSFNTNSQHKN